MMAKIVKGSDFKGVVDYIIDKKKDTQIVASEGLFMENLETIAMSFNAQSRMNDKVTKPVGHIALSFSKEDELRLTNRIMAFMKDWCSHGKIFSPKKERFILPVH